MHFLRLKLLKDRGSIAWVEVSVKQRRSGVKKRSSPKFSPLSACLLQVSWIVSLVWQQRIRRQRLLLYAVIQALLHYSLEDRLVFAQIIAGRGLDVLVAGEIFDVGDVCSVKQQVGTEGVAEQMRGQMLFYLCFLSQAYEESRDILTLETPDRVTGGDKQAWVIVYPLGQVFPHPEAAALGEEDVSDTLALTDNLNLILIGIKDVTVKSECF